MSDQAVEAEDYHRPRVETTVNSVQDETAANDESLRPISSSASSATLSSGVTAVTNESARSSSSSLVTESPTVVEKPPIQERRRSISPKERPPEFERRVTFSSEHDDTTTNPSIHAMGVDDVRPNRSTQGPPKTRRKKTWWRRFNRFPLANSLATLSLAVGAVGLLFFGERSLRNDTYNVYHSYVNNCLNWDTEKFGPLTPYCEDVIRQFRSGKLDPPYPVWKRAVDHLKKRAVALGGSSLDQNEHSAQQHNWIYITSLILLLLVIFVLALRSDIVTKIRLISSARQTRRRPSDFYIATQQRLQGYSKANYDGKDYTVLRHQPSSHEDLHKLGHWLRSSASSSSSSVDSSSSGELRRRSTQKRKLAIRHPTNDEEEAYDSLIELPSKKDTKIFFEPNTGAYIRLAPWKSQAEDEEDEKVEEGDMGGAIAKMGSGAAAFAAGKMVGQQIADEIECFEEGKIREKILPRATEGTRSMIHDDQPAGAKTS